MLKLFFLALLSAQALGQMADVILPVPASESEVIEGVEEREPGVEIFTFPFPMQPKHASLGLTTGDLKVFSGHALSLLKSKCPNVNPIIIFQLQKYFGKQIAKIADPVPGDNLKFRKVLRTVTTCAAEAIPRANNGQLPQADKPQTEEVSDVYLASSEEADVANNEGKSKKLISVIPKESPLSAPNWKAKWAQMSSVEKKEELSTVFAKNAKLQKESSLTTKTSSTTVRTTTVRSTLFSVTGSVKVESPMLASPFLSWISNAFTSITSFFSRIFGFGSRRRRDTASGEDSADEGQPIVVSAFSGPLSGFHKYHGETSTPKGQDAFVTLMDSICRVYCDKCRKGAQGINAQEFKTAGRELLDYLFVHVPSSGIELAAANYLTPEFLLQINQCVYETPIF